VPELAVFQRILVAVGDGSCADQLVTGVAGLASTGDAEVLLVHVSDCNVCCGAMDHPSLHEHEHELLRSLIERLGACGVKARGEARHHQRADCGAPAGRGRGVASRPAGRRRRPAGTSPRPPVAARSGEAAR